jgi:hypothetical protein
MPFHAVRARFMGSIASPLLDRSPVHAIQELWGGKFPPFDTMEDLNHFLDVLMAGLWNRLTAHQIASKPFRLTRLLVSNKRESLHRYATVRQQEVESFMDGLFGSHEELDLPESARDGLEVLGEMRAMLAGAIALLDDPSTPAARGDLKQLSDNFQALATILEKQINTVVRSCTQARRELLSDRRKTKPTVH